MLTESKERFIKSIAIEFCKLRQIRTKFCFIKFFLASDDFLYTTVFIVAD